MMAKPIECANSNVHLNELNTKEEVTNLNAQALNTSFNTYATRKTYATGLFDLALLAANFSQLKQLILSTSTTWTTFDVVLVCFITASLLLQFTIGILLVYIARQNEFIDEIKRVVLVRLNNATTVIILAVTIINIFLSVFVTVK
jgi:hypothetical protein